MKRVASASARWVATSSDAGDYQATPSLNDQLFRAEYLRESAVQLILRFQLLNPLLQTNQSALVNIIKYLFH